MCLDWACLLGNLGEGFAVGGGSCVDEDFMVYFVFVRKLKFFMGLNNEYYMRIVCIEGIVKVHGIE